MIFGVIVFGLWCFTLWLPKKLITGKQTLTFLGMVFMFNLFATAFIGFWATGLSAVAAGVENSLAPAVVGAVTGFMLASAVGGWSQLRVTRKFGRV